MNSAVLKPLSKHSASKGKLGLLVDHEAADREARRLTARLKFAALRLAACTGDVDLRAPGGIDRAVTAQLIDGGWIGRHENLRTTGPNQGDYSGKLQFWMVQFIGGRAFQILSECGNNNAIW